MFPVSRTERLYRKEDQAEQVGILCGDVRR